MMNNYLSQRRRELGLTQKEVADAVGVAEATVSRWESGEIANMRRDRIAALAKVLQCTADFIMNGEDAETEKFPLQTVPPGFEPLPKMVKKPLVGSIACGEPITAEENIEDYVDVPEDAHCDFCLRCKGDSMIDAGIHDGDVVYIHIQPQVENGQIAAVRIDGEATLKRVFWNETTQTLTLLAENRNFAPLVYTGPILETVHIEGKAVGYTHWF